MVRRLAALFAALCVWCSDARAMDGRWTRADSPHFIVYSDDPYPERVQTAVRDLEIFDALLRRLLRREDTERGPRLEIILMRSHDTLQQVRPNLPSGTQGFYAAGVDLIASFAVYRPRGVFEAQEVLFHEYAHHFMFQHFSGAYPAWFVEGFAEFVQTAEISPQRVTWGRPSAMRGPWLLDARWLPIERVLKPENFSRDDTANFYAQSWLMTHYFLNRPDHQAGLIDYFTRLQNGEDAVAAFEPAFGTTPDLLAAALRAYARGRLQYSMLDNPPFEAGTVSMTRLPRSADDLLPLVARLRLGRDDEDAGAALLARVRELAAVHGDDPYASLALARAEIEHGAPDAARPLIERVLAANPQHVDALYLMGLSYVKAARAAASPGLYRQARPYFVRAFRADPLHVPTLYRYVETFAGDAGLNEQQLDVLLRANTLAPQVDEIAANAGMQLMMFGRFREAEYVLLPLAFGAHGGSNDQILGLLEQARAGAAIAEAEEEAAP